MENTKELASELIDFLNEFGMYRKFIEWEKERGYNEDELESVIDTVHE